MTRGPSAGPSFRESRPALDRAVYEARTGEILVRVEPRFLPEQSDERERRYVWAYTVEIENHGEETVQLLSRRWLITDALNRTETVVGEGVRGEQPTLGARQAFRKVSAIPIVLFFVFAAIAISDRLKGGYKPEELSSKSKEFTAAELASDF